MVHLLPFLRGERPSAGKSVHEALGRIGGSEAAKALVDVLEGYQGRLRDPRIEALVEIGADAVAPCIEALGHREAGLRWAAAEVLGRIGDKRAVPHLIAALDDDKEDGARVRLRARDAHRRITGKDLMADEWRKWWAESRKGESPLPPATENP